MAFEYTTVDAVRVKLPENIDLSESSEPSDADATAWINEKEAEVDLALVAGGTGVPATNSRQVTYLGGLVSAEVAWMVMMARNAAKADHPYHVAWLAALDKIAEGIVADTTVDPLVHSYTMDAQTNNDAGMQPAFTRDKKY